MFNKICCCYLLGYSRNNPNTENEDMEFAGALKKKPVEIPRVSKKGVEFPERGHQTKSCRISAKGFGFCLGIAIKLL